MEILHGKMNDHIHGFEFLVAIKYVLEKKYSAGGVKCDCRPRHLLFWRCRNRIPSSHGSCIQTDNNHGCVQRGDEVTYYCSDSNISDSSGSCCCDPWFRDDDNNCNNNGTDDYNYNNGQFGKTPLSMLRPDGNRWTLVPCSTLDSNANKPGDATSFPDGPGNLGMGKGVYLETSHIDFLLCMAISGQSKDEILSRCESALLAADVNNVTESYLIAAKYGLQRVMDALIQLIRDNFILVTQTRQFLELPVDLVELFLSDTFVNVGDELDVFAVALRWVDYNKQDRLCQSGRVLNCVRYEKIRPVDIRDHIEPNIHLFNGPCGPEALVNIYRKHALMYSGVEDGGALGPRARHSDIIPNYRNKPITQASDKGKNLGGKSSATKSAVNLSTKPAGKPAAKTAGKSPAKGAGKAGAKGAGKPGAKGKNNQNSSRQDLPSPPLGASTGAKVYWRNQSASNSGRAQSVSRMKEENRDTHHDEFVSPEKKVGRACTSVHKKPRGRRASGGDDFNRGVEGDWQDQSRNSRSGNRRSSRELAVSSARASSTRRDSQKQNSRQGSRSRTRTYNHRPKKKDTWPGRDTMARGCYMDRRQEESRAWQHQALNADRPGFGYSVIVGSNEPDSLRDELYLLPELDVSNNWQDLNKSAGRNHRRATWENRY